MLKHLLFILSALIKGIEVSEFPCYYAKHLHAIMSKNVAKCINTKRSKIFEGFSAILDSNRNIIDIPNFVNGAFFLRPKNNPNSMLVKTTIIFTEEDYQTLISDAKYMFYTLNLQSLNLSKTLSSHVYQINSNDTENFEKSDDECFVIFSFFLNNQISLHGLFKDFVESINKLASMTVSELKSIMMERQNYYNFRYFYSPFETRKDLVELSSMISSEKSLNDGNIWSMFMRIIDRDPLRKDSVNKGVQAIHLLHDLNNLFSLKNMIMKDERTFEFSLNQYSLKFKKAFCFKLTDLELNENLHISISKKVGDDIIDVEHEIHENKSAVFILISEDVAEEYILRVDDGSSINTYLLTSSKD